MDFTIIITTHNRREDLHQSLLQLQKLDPPAGEILITADGCSDGTDEMLKKDFSEIKLLVNQPGKGSVASRDRMLREARHRFILSLDDDSYPVELDFFLRAQRMLQKYPQAGVIHFPQRSEEYTESLECNSFGPSQWTGSYPNSGALYDRDLYLSLPGFPRFFFHAYEEPDYGIQAIAAGRDVLFFTDSTIRHHWTGIGRNEGRTHRRHARNEALSILLRAPFWTIPLLLIYRAFRQFQYACKRGVDWVIREPLWWWAALKLAPTALRQRKPVPWSAYRKWLKLLGQPEPVESESEKVRK